MNSFLLRGYGEYDRIITRGFGTGWLGRIIYTCQLLKMYLQEQLTIIGYLG